MHDRLYAIIENNLILLGGTVVEDKLQDNIPQTIKELKSSGIKIWILTGDKLVTTESIGYNWNLLSKNQKIFVIEFCFAYLYFWKNYSFDLLSVVFFFLCPN